MAENLATIFNEGLLSMLETGEHSDLVLSCEDGTKFQVHKVILCAQSKFFQKALKPDAFKEGREGHIDLTVGDSATIDQMVRFMYTRNYNDCIEGSKDSLPIHSLLCNAKVHEIADFYVMPQLKILAATRFQTAAEDGKLNLADFIQAVAILYSTPIITPNLRTVVLKVIRDHSATLFADQNFAELLSSTAELGKDIALCMLPIVSKLELGSQCRLMQWSCCKCKASWTYSGKIGNGVSLCPLCRTSNTGMISDTAMD